MFLSGKELEGLVCGNPPVIKNMVNPKNQIQPNGVELTLRSVFRFFGSGQLTFDNSGRKLPEVLEIPFDESGLVFLAAGCYKIKFNEILSVPLDMLAIGRPRSSLLRMGVSIATALWDSGFKGETECLMIVSNPFGFRVSKDARLIQLLFSKLPTSVQKGYEGLFGE